MRNLGTAVIGTPTDVARPDFDFGPLTNDKVRQLTGGIGYELRWPKVAELSIGIQKTDYEKNTANSRGADALQPRTAHGCTTARWLCT